MLNAEPKPISVDGANGRGLRSVGVTFKFLGMELETTAGTRVYGVLG